MIHAATSTEVVEVPVTPDEINAIFSGAVFQASEIERAGQAPRLPNADS
jgi:hypothetical protein